MVEKHEGRVPFILGLIPTLNLVRAVRAEKEEGMVPLRALFGPSVNGRTRGKRDAEVRFPGL